VTEDEADYAAVHLNRAMNILANRGPQFPAWAADAAKEIRRALMLCEPHAEPPVPIGFGWGTTDGKDPYADPDLRPGLNRTL